MLALVRRLAGQRDGVGGLLQPGHLPARAGERGGQEFLLLAAVTVVVLERPGGEEEGRPRHATRPSDNPGGQYPQLLQLGDPERFPCLAAAMAQRAAAPPADFADDEFRFGLSTVLDGIACRA